MNSPYISDRFRRAVLLHLVKNFSPSLQSRASLILGIHGPSGEGKTFQCQAVLGEVGARVILLSGGQLEGPNAGQPVELLRRLYSSGGKRLDHTRPDVPVLVVDDIDTGIGGWGGVVQYTINRQLLFGELMHLCDFPTSVAGQVTRRIPIIMTANDLTKLYGPLLRPGRMSAFEWKPTPTERQEIVTRLFPELQRTEVGQLIETLQGKARRHLRTRAKLLPVAFFSQLRSDIVDEALWLEMSAVDPKTIVGKIAEGYDFVNRAGARFERIVEAGERLIQAMDLTDHLSH